MATELQTLVQTDEPPIVFVSYSHKDEAWKDKLLPQLKNLDRLGILQVWDDRDIKAGVDWYAKIHDVLSKTKVAICLISPDFLSSSFCLDEEVSYLLQRRNRGDLEIFPILLRDCVWDEHYWLKRLQMLPRDGKTIRTHFNEDPDLVFADVARQVRDFLKTGKGWERPKPKGPAPTVDINRLPTSNDILFGRRDELNFLDKIWKDNDLNLTVFKASGGVGKTSLVHCWAEDMALDNYRGARRVFAWSFYSQGTNERVTSADLFLAEALEWFGDKTRGEGLSAWDRGQRLADLIRQQRTLLLLDGLEPLQSGQAFDRGKIKDPGLEVLLFELAKHNPGLCLITTREEVTDLWYEGDDVSVGQFDLDKISTTAGRALLRVRGIQGDDDELEQAVRDFGQHAYAIKLLGNFLAEEGTPHIKHAAEIPDLPNVDENDGKHPRRVMAAFANHFGQCPKSNILAMLGLFDRPADAGCIKALRASPAVAGLNNAVQGLDENEWTAQIEELRLLGLLTPHSHHVTDELDAHPLVREHFGARLHAQQKDAWTAGHERQYRHLITVPEKHQPDTLEEMAPLYQAIHHGCMAGDFQHAFQEVYSKRIQRGDVEVYALKRLGAVGSDLAALSSFFDQGWSKKISDVGSGAGLKRFELDNQVGYRLYCLGRLEDAIILFEKACSSSRESGDVAWLSVNLLNISDVNFELGCVQKAMTTAKEVAEISSEFTNLFALAKVRLARTLNTCGDREQALMIFEELFQEDPLCQQYDGIWFHDPRLLSYRTFFHAEALLDAGDVSGAERLAGQLSKESNDGTTVDNNAAFDNLTLGWVYLKRDELNKAQELFDTALISSRSSARIGTTLRCLIANAVVHRCWGKISLSYAALDEAMRLAKRCGMRLHECDAHLEYTRLALAEGNADDARTHLKSAASLVAACGYGRRKGEVAELEAALT